MQWGPACKPLELTVETAPRAQVRYLGQSYRADEKGTMFASVPSGKLGKSTTIAIVVEDERGATAQTQVTVPPQPGALVAITAHRNLKEATANGESLERLDPPRDTHHDKAYKPGKAKLDDAVALDVELDGCNLSPGTLQVPNAEIVVERERVRVTDRVGTSWASALGSEEPVVEITAQIPTAHGKPIALRLKSPVKYTKELAARFWRITKEPVKDAPDPKEVAAPRSILVASYGTHLGRDLLDAKTSPMTAPYVALVDIDSKEFAACFYGGTVPEAAATRSQPFTSVRIVTARTGRVVASKLFLGGMPKPCPRSVLVRGGITDVDLDGKDVDDAVVDAWIAKFRD